MRGGQEESLLAYKSTFLSQGQATLAPRGGRRLRIVSGSLGTCVDLLLTQRVRSAAGMKRQFPQAR
jgi:hypothetical protein